MIATRKDRQLPCTHQVIGRALHRFDPSHHVRQRVDCAIGMAEVAGDGSRVTGLACRHRTSGKESRVPVAGVFVQIGLMPNTEWLKGTAELTPRGEVVVVDDRLGVTMTEIVKGGVG